MQRLYLPGYTVKESEALSGLPYNTMYKHIKSGKIKASKDVFGQWRISYADLVAFIAAREQD